MSDLIDRNLPSAETHDKRTETHGVCLDAISRQAAIDWCLEGLNNMPSAQPKPQWIPCSERLPNGQTEVIVSCRDDSADTIYRYTASGWITTDGEYWIVDNEINPYVIAWMPLPEPYREEGEE